MAYLEAYSPNRATARRNFLALLHARSQRLFHKDVFARGQRLQAERDVELIGRGDDNRFNLWVREHVGKVGIGLLRLVNGGHALD